MARGHTGISCAVARTQREKRLAFQTIAKAETLARPGDKILLRPGTHALSSALTITKRDVLVAGRRARIIGPTSDGYFICLNADGVSLVGVEVDGRRGDSKSGGVTGAIYVSARHNRIADCAIQASKLLAFRVLPAGSGDLRSFV
jgi:hypothetical protein